MASTSTMPIVSKQTFSVRLPLECKKKYSVLKFNAANKVDFSQCKVAKIERENNLKEFKSAYDIDSLPKFGAGSEFGREQREEARKKKFGVRIRKYNSEEQPWLLKMTGERVTGEQQQRKMFRGTRDGGVAENSSFYIFMQCSDNKTFEAVPVNEWYNFTPQVQYKYLNAEEAEEEFTRRDKTLNLFNVMVRKRLKNDDSEDVNGDLDEGEPGKKKTKKNKADKSLIVSEFDEMSNDDDDDDDDDDEDGEGKSSEGKSRQKQKKTSDRRRNKKKKSEDSDEEAIEESDEQDEGEEVDYMSGSSSDDEQMYDDKGRDESDKYQDKGVEDEEGLRKLFDSGDEEEEEKEEEEPEDEEKPKESNSDSSSDSDSDPEKETFASALLISDKRSSLPVKSDAASNSRPSTPSNSSTSAAADAVNKAKKRKAAETSSPMNSSKKPKSETLASAAGNSSTYAPSGDGGITEDAVRRYLLRKPMTIKDLVQKFKSRNAEMTKEQMTTTIAAILKRLNPKKSNLAGGKMVLSLDANS